MIFIKVPATTANFGTGFDALGMALNLHNTYYIEKSIDSASHLEWLCDKTVEDQDNLTLNVIDELLRQNQKTQPYHLKILSCDIPYGKGLGSSAAAIVAGCLAANFLLDFKYSIKELMALALDFEPHPDNLAPAFFGGMILSSLDRDSRYIFSHIRLDDDLRFFAFIPHYVQSTSLSRAALPNDISLQTHVINAARACCLINALNQRQYNQVRHGLTDTIHQPLRLACIPEADRLMALSRTCGAIGEFLSGSGPTIISIVHRTEAERFGAMMKERMAQLSIAWNVLELTADAKGARGTLYRP